MIPVIGVVVPVLQPAVDRDATLGTIFSVLDKAFLSGAAIYPETASLGTVGNAVIGGHSSFWKTHRSPYKTIFTKLPELVTGDEVWGFTRRKNNGEDTGGSEASSGEIDSKKRDITIYTITESYYMKIFDPHIFDQPRDRKQVSLYTCVPIGTQRDRRIIRAEEKQ